MKVTLATCALLLILLVLPDIASAQEDINCSDGAVLIEHLQADIQEADTILIQLRSVVEDSATAEMDTDQLEALFNDRRGEADTRIWPEQVSCEALSENYAAGREHLQRTQGHITGIRDRLWRRQPQSLVDALTSVWRSRQRVLLHQQEVLASVDPPYDPDIHAQLTELNSDLSKQRQAFLQLLPSLADEVTANDIEEWIELWRDSQSQVRQTAAAVSSLQALASGQPPEAAALLREHRRILELDALVMSVHFNIGRSQLWQEHRAAFNAAVDALKLSDTRLLGLEMRAVRTIFQWLYVDARVDFKPAGGVDSFLWRYLQVGEYLFGVLCFLALAALARWLRSPVSNFHAKLAQKYRKQRMCHQILRGTANFPTLLPWLIGWFGLDLLKLAFAHYHLVLLLPLIPFAKIFILYGLVAEFCSWMLHRINERARVFLSSEQSSRIARQSRYASAIILLPWLLQAMAKLTIGSALLVHHLRWLTLLSIVFALGLLLHLYRKEFVAALQTYLPELIDPWVERLFAPRASLLLRPFGLPVLLLGQLIEFFHRGLIDFDWYRRISARSFTLRSQVTADTASFEGKELEEYRKWFGSTGFDKQVPYINVEMLTTLQDAIAGWQAHQTEENSLLITGARGAGKSSLLKRLAGKLQDEQLVQVHYIDVPAKTAEGHEVADLLGSVLGVNLSAGPAALVASEKERGPTVVMIDDAQNLFLRKVGGLSGWELLLSLTRTRVQSIYWVIAISNPSWSYLRQVFGGDFQFSRVVRTRAWSQGEIRSLIMSRHQLSGLSLEYDDILLATRGPEAGNVRNAEQLYFNLLWDASRGNPMQALEIWLKSIAIQGKSVLVGLPQQPSLGALDNLGDDMLFVYAALMLHENMSSDELVETTAIPESTIRAALKTAFDAGFVWRTEDRRYRIVPVWIPLLSKLLHRKNLLHE